MTAINIISGILLAVASVAIILAVLFTNTDNAGINSAIGGGQNNSFYGRNGGDRREATRELVVKIIVAVFFVVAIVCTILAKVVGNA